MHDLLRPIIEFPCYTFERRYENKVEYYYCRKLGDCDVSYRVKNISCTCLSFMKGHVCKHMKMLNSDFEWYKGEAAHYEVEDYLTELLIQISAVPYPFELNDSGRNIQSIRLELASNLLGIHDAIIFEKKIDLDNRFMLDIRKRESDAD